MNTLTMKRFWQSDKLRGAIYLSLMSAAALLGVGKQALFAKILTPDEFGTYALIVTIYVYIVYAGALGLNEGLIKLVSTAYGKNDQESVLRLRDISLFYGILATSACGLLYVVGVKILISDAMIANTLALAAPLAVASLGFNLVDGFMRANQKILHFAAMLFLRAVGIVALGYSIGALYGVNGVVLAELATTFIIFLLFLWTGGAGFKARRLRQGRTILVNVIRNGLPFMSSMLIRNVSISIDRWAIASSVGLAALGNYAFGMLIYNVAITAAGFLTNVLGPRWLSRFAKTRDVPGLFRDITRIAVILLFVAIIFFVPVTHGFERLTAHFYPAYAHGDVTSIAMFAYVGVTLLVCCQLFDWLFIATSCEPVILRLSMWGLGFATMLTGFAYWSNAGVVVYAKIFLACRILTAGLYWRKIVWLLRTFH